MNDKRINGCALELIMRDVLDGMRDFTHAASTGSQTDAMDILGIDRAVNTPESKACIIPFPQNPRLRRKA
jgi:hypothetical protein